MWRALLLSVHLSYVSFLQLFIAILSNFLGFLAARSLA